MRIRINEDEIGYVSKTMDDETTELENEIEKFHNEIDKLSTIWVGADASKFIITAVDFSNKLLSVPDTMRVINHFMTKTTSQVMDKDLEFGNEISMGVDYHENADK